MTKETEILLFIFALHNPNYEGFLKQITKELTDLDFLVLFRKDRNVSIPFIRQVYKEYSKYCWWRLNEYFASNIIINTNVSQTLLDDINSTCLCEGKGTKNENQRIVSDKS